MEHKNKKELLYILFISMGIDILASLVESPFVIELLGTPIIVEELLELILSNLLAKNKIKLKWYDYLIGMIPIPGITAISIHVLRKLLLSSRKK